MDFMNLVGRPVPPLPAARDVILHALSRGQARTPPERGTRLWDAMQELLNDGLITQMEDELRLTPGAGDVASQAAIRISAFREARAAWGRDLQAALRARRAPDQESFGSMICQ